MCILILTVSLQINKKSLIYNNSPLYTLIKDDRVDIDHHRLEAVVCVVTIASGLVSGAGGIEASRLIKDVALGL